MALEAWSGRRVPPSEVCQTPSQSDVRDLLVVATSSQPRFASEAENDAEALLYNLTSPSGLRRRGARSALRMMVDEARRFDQYDQIVPAAAAVTESEWETGSQQRRLQLLATWSMSLNIYGLRGIQLGWHGWA